ncbi:unnamed protein product [Effrenium voratum]|nr:unnamed protein product [Effrenium voratum]
MKATPRLTAVWLKALYSAPGVAEISRFGSSCHMLERALDIAATLLEQLRVPSEVNRWAPAEKVPGLFQQASCEASPMPEQPRPVTVVTFYTEGPPWDNCLPLTHVVEELREILARSDVRLLAYTPRSLQEDDFYQRHCMREQAGEAEPYMELLPHAHKLGYYAWKPLVISKALSQLQTGEILLFMDANIQK